jgi:hypothetical protein
MRMLPLMRLAVVLSLPGLTLAHEQQVQTFTWSSTKCDDGTPTAWTGCKMVRSGNRLSEPGLVFEDGLFAEELDGKNADIAVTVTKLRNNFLVHIGFKAATADHPYTIVPPDAVKIVATSVIRPTAAKDVPDSLEVAKLRFKENEQVAVGPDLWTFGYLFFPFDDLAPNITVVIRVGNETFRFPFASKPNAPLEWSDPQTTLPIPSAVAASAPNLSPPQTSTPISTSTSIPASIPTSTPTTPAPVAASTASVSATELPSHATLTRTTSTNGCSAQPAVDVAIAFGIADSSGVHPGVMGWTRNWINKNAKNFPTVAFQGCAAESLRNYLIVFSSSKSVLNGFDPVLRSSTSTSTSPVSGTGTVSNMYGSTWNYT